MTPKRGEPTLEEVLRKGIGRGGAARVGGKGKSGEGVPSLRRDPGVLGLGALCPDESAGIALAKSSHGAHISEERIVDGPWDKPVL